MAYSDIRDGLKATLEAISGVENVMEYHRLISDGIDSDAFRGLFVNGSDIHAWRFTRTAVSQAQCADTDNTVKRTHTIEIEAYYNVVDSAASENTFQDLIDTALDSLNNGDRTLGGVCVSYSLPQVSQILAVTFYGAICHLARITLQIEENA